MSLLSRRVHHSHLTQVEPYDAKLIWQLPAAEVNDTNDKDC